MDNLVELYCIVDEFSQEFMPEFEKNQLEMGIKQRRKPCQLSPSEVMTIIIYFHQMQFRNFKIYYSLRSLSYKTSKL